MSELNKLITKAPGLASLSEKAPGLTSLILVVGLFLLFNLRHDALEVDKLDALKKLSDQRIETCHSVQNDSKEALKDNTKALIENAKAMTLQAAALHELRMILIRNNGGGD